MIEGCVPSSAQGQGCTIIQPAPLDGLRVKRVLYCLAPLHLHWPVTPAVPIGIKILLVVPLPPFTDPPSLTLEVSLWEAGIA